MKSLAIKAANPEIMAAEIIKNFQSGFVPTVGLVFCDINQDVKAIASFFNQHGIQLIGCSTAGEISMTDSFSEHIVVLLMDMNTKDFIIDHRTKSSANDEDLLMKEVSEVAKKSYNNPALLLFGCGVKRDNQKMVSDINEFLGKDTPVYGGVAGGDETFSKTICFTNNGIMTDGLVSLIINGDKIKLDGLAVSGWERMGNINVVTKAIGNVILEINNEPALDFFTKHFGFENYEVNDERMVMPGNYPLEMVNKNGYQRLRSIMSFDIENKALILGAGVTKGDTFHFCLPPSLDVLQNSITQFQKMAQKGVKADAVVLISCMARKVVFGPLIDHEIKGIQEIWKKPLVGFFSFGEIGRISDQDMCDLHNCTSNLLTISEVN